MKTTTTKFASMKQPAVFKTYKRGQIGIDTTYVDERETQIAIEALLKSLKITMPVTHCDGTIMRNYHYPINVTVLNGYSDRKQYRVYIGDWSKKDTFVQSDKNGVIDLEKLVRKITEFITINNKAERRRKTEWIARNAAKSRLGGINSQLHGTGFKLEMENGHYNVRPQDGYHFYECDLNELVAKLMTFKK